MGSLESDLAVPTRGLLSPAAWLRVRARSRPEVDVFEVCVLATFAGLSMWVVAVNLWLAARHGLVWTGIDGQFPVDQMQYLAWVQDASHHLLVSDLFTLRPTPHDYLQPMVAVSGILTAAGLVPWLALLLWKPVAVVGIFLAVRAYARRLFARRGEQRAALVLGLFAAAYGSLGDEWLPFMSWGYVFGLAAVAAMVAALVTYDRSRRAGRFSLIPGGLALLASWLHPWQGELLILIILAGEFLPGLNRPELPRGRAKRLPALTLGAAALPLLYYELLQRQDPAWRFADGVTPRHPVGLAMILLPILPLALAALPAYTTPSRSFLDRATRLWPPAALVVWALETGGLGPGALHAWTGITIPLAALAVRGVGALGGRRLPGARYLAVAAVLALTLPGGVLMMKATIHWIMPARHNQNLNLSSDQRALTYIAHDPLPGGVLSSYYLGDEVPGETGRHTYAGDARWSGPAFKTREQMAWELLHGGLRPGQARASVRRAGVRFVLADCRSRADLSLTLAPLLLGVDRFGCAAVYEVK